MKNTNKIPRTVDQFEQVTEASTESALKVEYSAALRYPVPYTVKAENLWDCEDNP